MCSLRAASWSFLACLILAQCTNMDTSAGVDASTGGDGACVPSLSEPCAVPHIMVITSSGALKSPAKQTVVASGSQDLELTVTNTGTAPLLIKQLLFDYVAPVPESTSAFACLGSDGVMPCAQIKWPEIAPSGQPGTTSVKLAIRYVQQADAYERHAELRIVTNTPGALSEFRVDFTGKTGAPKLQVEDVLDLGFVKAPATAGQALTIHNVGDGALIVSAIDASALSKAFLLTIGANAIPAGALIPLNPPLSVAPGQLVDVMVIDKAADDLPHDGDLILQTNDPSLGADGGPGWKRVHVKVNEGPACVKAIPSEIVFGGTKVGNAVKQQLVLKSCGSVDVHVTSVAVIDAAPVGVFALQLQPLPLTIGVNAQVSVHVTYTPTTTPKTDAAGSPIPDAANFIVQFAEPAVPTVKVPCSGFGVP